jgi:CBS domain-containing protein
MIIEDVVAFLKYVPPFQFLDEPALSHLAVGMSMEFFPKGTTILRQGGPASGYLYVIKKGGVKVFRRSAGGEDTIIEFRGQGDLFGYLSLFGGDKSRAYVVTVEDTTCYTIRRETVRHLLDSNNAVREFFLKSFLNIYIDKTFQEMHGRSLFFSGCGDRILFSTAVGEVVNKVVLTAPQKMTIREAAVLMCDNKISSLILADDEDKPVGIITDRDMRGKVVAKGRDVNDPVSSIMSYPLMRIDARDYCFEAVLKMIKYNVHHLIVVSDGALAGIVTNHDLMLLQGTSPLLVAKDIESQQDIEGLAALSKQIYNVIGILLKQGARASNITRIVSEISDRLVRKILEIAERRFGRPPLQYCWVVFGSEGRKEQAFRTDQDNAIIFADPITTYESDEAKKYFSVFAAFVRDSLVQCGYPFCPDAHMASNPRWCRSLSDWKKFFSDWVAAPATELGEAGVNSLIFLDFRAVGGEFSLADQLRDSLTVILRGRSEFIGHIAGLVARNKPPIGFLKSVMIEKSGEHKDKLNLKVKGLAPLVGIVRLFSLEAAIRETSTLERLDALKARNDDVAEYGEEIAHAFEFIMLLRLQHHMEQLSRGQELDNLISPDSLTNLQKKTIKEAFNLISKLQESISERYKPLKRVLTCRED